MFFDFQIFASYLGHSFVHFVRLRECEGNQRNQRTMTHHKHDDSTVKMVLELRAVWHWTILCDFIDENLLSESIESKISRWPPLIPWPENQKGTSTRYRDSNRIKSRNYQAYKGVIKYLKVDTTLQEIISLNI